MGLRTVRASPVFPPAIFAARSFTCACPLPCRDAHDDEKEPVKWTDDIVKRRCCSFEKVGGNRDYGACEPWAKQRAGIAPVKEATPDTPYRFPRSG